MPLEPRKTTPGIPLHSEFRGGESDTIREIPPEWRAALDLTVEEIPMPWDQPVHELTDTILASKAEQQYTSERKMRTTVKPPGVVFLFESYTDRHKQLGVRQRSFHFIDDWPSVVPSPSALVDVETKNFGNKHFELRQDTIPGLFVADSFCSEIPVVTPPDFRAMLGEQEHCSIQLGTAAAPPDPLPLGTIKWCDNQEDLYTHKVCITTLDLDIPAEIDNSRTNRFKQVETLERRLVLDTTTPAVPTSIQDVIFTKLGDGTALQERNYTDVRFDEHKWTRERGIVTPQDFRAKLTEKEESQVVPGTAGDPGVLPTGILTHSQEQVDVFTLKDVVRSIDILSLPKEIDNIRTNRFKQQETVKRILELETATPFPITSLRDVTFTKLGDGTALEERVEIDQVFPENRFMRERPVVTPQDFRALLTEDEQSHITDIGHAVDPPVPLPAGVIRQSDEDLTAFTHRITTRTIDTLSLPQIISNVRTNRFKQVENVDRLLRLDTAIPFLPTTTRDVTFTKLGDGTALEERMYTDIRFDEHKWIRDRPIVTPQDFRALLTEKEESQIIPGIAADPGVPPAGVVQHSEEQVDVFTKRDVLRTIDTLSLPAFRNNKETNQFKQVVDVTRTLELDSSTPTAPTATKDVEFTMLGDGTALQIEKESHTVFSRHKWTRERPIVTPSDFRALLTEKEESSVFIGIATDPGVPPTGVLRHEEEQVDVFNMRDTLRTIDIASLPAHRINVETNRFKQKVLVTRTLELDSTIPSLPSNTRDVEFTMLGDGTAVEVWKDTYNATTGLLEVFDEKTATREIPDLVPEIFRAVLPTDSEEFVETGSTINDPPTLATGDLFREEKRETEFTRRIRHRGRASVVYPQTKTALRQIGGEKFGGEILRTDLTLDTFVHVPAPSVDSGLLVVESRVQDLGNGTWLKTTEQVDTSIAWPVLASRLWDANMRVMYDQTEQVVAAGTPEDVGGTGVLFTSEVKSIDKWRSKKINITKPSPIYTASSPLITFSYRPYKFPGLIYYANVGVGLAQYVRRASAQLCRHTVRTWWEYNSLGTPSIAVDEIIMAQVIINNLDLTGLTYADDVLNDAYTRGTITYPDTTPNASTYIGSWQGVEKIIAASVSPEKEKNVWKCQTTSIVMR